MIAVEKKSFWQNYRFPIILLIAIGIGSILGIIMGKDAMIFKPFGDVFINLMFTAVVPMVFVTIASAVGNMLNMKRLGSILGNMFFMKLISIIMLYAPIGLGAYFASLIGEFGPQLLGAYAKAMLIYYPVCFLYFIIAFAGYSYLAGGKLGVKTCFKNILPPAITAFATGSSIATLPVNLDAAQKMGVPKDIREIVLPIGATMHMDGTCLSSILKISFLFGIFGQEFTGIETFLTAMLISVLGGVVMSGVPGGGLIGEMLIVNLYGFPPEAFPIIATLGFLVDPPATMVNAAGDSVSAMMVTRLVEGKEWLKDHFIREENIVK